VTNKKTVVGIYEDSGAGVPDDKLAQSSETSMTQSTGTWGEITVSYAFSTSDVLWIAVASEETISSKYAGGTAYELEKDVETYNATLPDPVSTTTVSGTRQYSFYCNYTTVSNELVITSPGQYQIYQRDGSNEADIPVSGTYVGSPTAVECDFAGGGYSTVDSSPGSGTWSGTLATQSAGQGTLTCRWTNNTAVNDTTADVGIGDIYMIAGQSNHAGRLTNAQTWTDDLKGVMWCEDSSGWELLSDPTDPEGDATPYGSIWPLLLDKILDDQSVPVGVITCADGGTNLSGASAEWNNTETSHEECVTEFDNSGANDVKAILWLQGEAEAIAGSISSATHQTNMSAMLDDLHTGMGVSPPMGVATLLKLTSANSRADKDAIVAALINRYNNDADMFPGPVLADIEGDGLHIISDADAQEFADRWWHFLDLKFYGGSEGRGPRFSAAYKMSARVIRVVFTVANGPLTAQTDVSGWRVVDDTGVLTISSAAAYGTTGVDLTVNRDLDTNPVVSWGSGDDAADGTATILDSSTVGLPPEPFFSDDASGAWVGAAFAPLVDGGFTSFGGKLAQ
jgi:hypothetical protein